MQVNLPVVAGVVVLSALPLAACHHGGGSAAPSASAAISSLIADPHISAAEKAWGPALQSCYAAQPHHVLKPIVSLRGAFRCTLGKLPGGVHGPAAQKAEQCFGTQITNMVTHADLSSKGALDAGAVCLADAAPAASGTPSPGAS